VFGISFSELFVIAIVALLVIGPEKLPKVARTIGALTGRMQRYAAQVKEEVNREFRFEELQKLQEEIKQAVISTEQNVQQEAAKIENSIANVNETRLAPVEEATQQPATVRKSRTKPVKTAAKDFDKKPALVEAALTGLEKESVKKHKKISEPKNLAEKVGR